MTEELHLGLDYDKVLEGICHLEFGVDFDCDLETLKDVVRKEAACRGIKVKFNTAVAGRDLLVATDKWERFESL